jgi:hypothetical protein
MCVISSLSGFMETAETIRGGTIIPGAEDVNLPWHPEQLMGHDLSPSDYEELRLHNSFTGANDSPGQRYSDESECFGAILDILGNIEELINFTSS